MFERVLSRLFPVRNYVIRTPDEAKSWFQYEASNHPKVDPFRPLGKHDSWAGNIVEHDGITLALRRKRWQQTFRELIMYAKRQNKC